MPEDKKEVSVRLHRDSKGEIRLIGGVSPNLAIEVEILPLTYGVSRKLESFGEALYDWSDEDKITVLNDHVITPEIHIDGLDDLYDNFDAWIIEELLQSVFLYSGMGRLYGEDTEGNVEGEDQPEDENSQ